jgi:hypothetical protein
MLALPMVMLQVATVAGPPAAPPIVIPKPIQATGDCAAGHQPKDGEIVVCARPQEAYRLRPLPDRYTASKSLPKAEVKVFGNAKLSAEAEQGADAQGSPINRAMVHLKIPF